MARFLVVEADQDLAEAFKLMLDFAGHEADFVPDGSIALDYLKIGILPDGIITNLIQAGLDGLNLCRMIKLNPEWAKLPVILIANATDDAMLDALAHRVGATVLLRRPLVRERFLSELDRALLMAPVHANPLGRHNPAEESSFLRDYNGWLSRMMYHAAIQLRTTTADRDLRDAHVYAVNTITTALGETLDLNRTIETLVHKTADLMRAQAAALYLYDEEKGFELRFVAGYGIPTPSLTATYHMETANPLRLLLGGHKALLFSRKEQVRTLQKNFGISVQPSSAIVSPLLWRGDISGFLLVMRLDDPFDKQDTETLTSLGGVAGLALRSSQLFTELETAYEELQVMDRRRSEFVAITSHELRTPLAIMLGYASLLHDMEEDPGKKTQLGAIEKQATFLTGMVDTLINLHELIEENAPISLKSRPVHIDRLLRDAIDVTIQHSPYEKTVHFRLDSDEVQIEGDEVRLLLAFNNLLDNALKFSESDSNVEVLAAERPEGGVVVTIQDYGMGIDEEHYEQIFEPFYQVEPALTRHHGGMGLGLAIVRGMVNLHGGSIEVKSRPNEGTRFIVTLPAKLPEGRAQDNMFS